jgi:hypothetical protein
VVKGPNRRYPSIAALASGAFLQYSLLHAGAGSVSRSCLLVARLQANGKRLPDKRAKRPDRREYSRFNFSHTIREIFPNSCKFRAIKKLAPSNRPGTALAARRLSDFA